MRLFLILFMLFVGFNSAFPQEAVTVVVSKQEVVDLSAEANSSKKADQSISVFRFPAAGDVPAGNRRIALRVTNRSNHPVVIYGVAYDLTFQPSGFLVTFDESRHDWNYPRPERKLGEETSMLKQDKKVLNPGESFEFPLLLNFEADRGKLFKRTIYYASGNCEHPVEVTSSEFSIVE